MRLKIDKRADEHLAAIRRVAEELPTGKRNRILNRCDRLEMLYRRMEEDPRTSEDMQTEIVGHYQTTRKIIAALISGRSLSYKNMREFRTVEWHTRIHEAREIIAKRYPEYSFCSKWITEDKHPYKLYWLETK